MAERDGRRSQEGGAPQRALDRYDEPRSDRLTRRQVVEAAIGLVDREGLGALSIRKLAGELRVPPMTLYGVIDNKEHLEDLLIDHILANVALDLRADGWHARLGEIARRVRDVIRAHPEVTPLMATRGSLGPCFLDVVDAMVGTLLNAGFDAGSAATGAMAVLGYTIGYHLQPAAVPPGAPAPRPEEPLDRAPLQTFLASLPADRFPHIATTHEYLWPAQDEAVFDHGLAALIAGLGDPT
jgi:TetR/AcrR family tetracycline transcriptional repressor